MGGEEGKFVPSLFFPPPMHVNEYFSLCLVGSFPFLNFYQLEFYAVILLSYAHK